METRIEEYVVDHGVVRDAFYDFYVGGSGNDSRLYLHDYSGNQSFVDTQRLRLHQHQRRCQCLRACLHQASALTLRQLCDYASDTILIEINGLTP